MNAEIRRELALLRQISVDFALVLAEANALNVKLRDSANRMRRQAESDRATFDKLRTPNEWEVIPRGGH